MNAFVEVIVVCAILIAAWFVNERFSPDPLLTKLVQIALFVIAIIVIVKQLLPALGVHW